MKPNAGDLSRSTLLVPVLADLWDLASRCRFYQWNVVGPQFLYLAELFRAQARELEEQVECLAERIRTLGGIIPGPILELLRQSRLPPRIIQQPPARDMVAHLLADHELVIQQERSLLLLLGSDRVTQELVVRLLERHEQNSRVLRSFLETPQDGGS
jgi:starvation-inducible DNA-binding protein